MTKRKSVIEQGQKVCAFIEQYAKLQKARRSVRLSTELSKLVRIVRSLKMLIDLNCNFEYKVIPAESGTAHSPSPRLAILDEVGQLRGPHDAFIEAIETA